MNSKVKLLSLDILRGIACLMVVIIHATSNYLIDPSREAYRLFFAGLNTFAGSAVAVFIFISGMSLTSGYKDKEINYREFIKRRLKKVGLPYLAWAFFYSIVIKWGMWLNYGALALLGVTLGFSMYHLYYMVIIIQFYLIYPFLMQLHKRLPYIWLPVLCFLISIWFSFKNVTLGPWHVKDRIFLTYLGYFSLGIYAGLHRESWQNYLARWLKPLGLVWLFTGTLATVEVYTFYSPWRNDLRIFGNYRYMIFAVISIVFIYGAADWLSRKESSLAWEKIRESLKNISVWSLDIYLVHPFFLACIDRLWSYLPKQDSIVRFMLTFVFILGGSIVFSWLKGIIMRLYMGKHKLKVS